MFPQTKQRGAGFISTGSREGRTAAQGKGIPPKDDLPVRADDSGMTQKMRHTVTICGALSVLLSNTFYKI